MQENLAPIAVLGLLGLCFLGQDLGDARLGNKTEPYQPAPQVCEFVDGGMQCKPVQQ
jgi:hypothetical protein